MDEAVNSNQAAGASLEHFDPRKEFELLKYGMPPLNRKPTEVRQGTNDHQTVPMYPTFDGRTAYLPASESPRRATPQALDHRAYLLRRDYALEPRDSSHSRDYLLIPGPAPSRNHSAFRPPGMVLEISDPVDSSPSRCSPCGPHLNASGQHPTIGTKYPRVYFGYGYPISSVCKNPGVGFSQATSLPRRTHASTSPDPGFSDPKSQGSSKATNTGPNVPDYRKGTRTLDLRVEQSGISHAKEAKSVTSSRSEVRTDGFQTPVYDLCNVSNSDDLDEAKDSIGNFDGSDSEGFDTPCSSTDDDESLNGLARDDKNCR
ncbi:hypothetical protein IL306_005613 [Fusarium sp. DS 682]|nr:hypothetical protein IL306_005613 [Fusarium sp. DS 682]